MLPLWIIDLTKSDDRRARFRELLGQTEFVCMSENQILQGEYRWFYSSYDTDNTGFTEDFLSINEDLSNKSEGIVFDFSSKVYAFQNQLVKDGQSFIRMIRHSTLHAYSTLNVIVLGDSSEKLTRLIFSSVALLLQKEKGRMLANHIHQGMSVMGALFVPSNINSLDVNIREHILRTLIEIDTQNKITNVRGYDHMLLYQDVQNRTDKYYPLLDPIGQAEYIYQCLIHLFYACNTQHPLISGVGSADSFYLSMGVASVGFDNSIQDQYTANQICNDLFKCFYANRENDNILLTENERKRDQTFLQDAALKVEDILKTIIPAPLELNVEMKDPKPDPIENYNVKFLKRSYFKYYLKYWIPEYRRLKSDKIEEQTKPTLEMIHNHFIHKINDVQNDLMPEEVLRFFERCSADEGGLCVLETKLKNQKEKLAVSKKRIPNYVEETIWHKVMGYVDILHQDYFESYHDAYNHDLETKKEVKQCEQLKKDAIVDLCNHLSKETPILSRIARSFLLGVACVIFSIPLLCLFMSVQTVKDTAGIWSFLFFLIPALVELCFTLRYHVVRRRKFNRLDAYLMHDAYARIANRVMSETAHFYDKILVLCDRYLERAEKMRKGINDFTRDSAVHSGVIPETQFNQKLVEGSFCGHVLLDTSCNEKKKILISHSQKEVDSLNASDYYSLIHRNKEMFYELFSDIRLPQEHPVEIIDGVVRLLSPDEVKINDEKHWESIQRNFIEKLPDEIEEDLVPLLYPSACDMLMQYFKRTSRASIIKPFIAYAATNGEFTTSANIEHADVKTLNSNISEIMNRYLPESTVYQQEISENDDLDDDESIEARNLFSKYIFLTRWASYDDICLNRILPMEDFDLEEQKRQINESGRKGKTSNNILQHNNVPNDDGSQYPVSSSSALLWSLCEVENSISWLKLFHPKVFSDARQKSERIREILTQKD